MWAKNADPLSGAERFFSALVFKAQVVLRSITAFVLMSTVTAMTVRTLLSSGVVMIFPMAMLMERMGLHGADLNVRGDNYIYIYIFKYCLSLLFFFVFEILRR